MTIPVFTPNKRQRAYEDLSGRDLNKLKVLYRTDNYVTPSGVGHAQYACRCECGKECVVRATNLKSGKTVSCGCIRKESMQGIHLKDLTGHTFERWTVLNRADSIKEPSGRNVTMWKCRCECGEERDIRGGSLKTGLSKSCGCLKTDVLSKVRHLDGQTFGRWLVLAVAPDQITPKGRSMKRWSCRCECGNVREVTEQSLVRGTSVSCGCYRIEQLRDNAVFADLSGKSFGEWVVLERVPDRFYPGGGRATMWKCRCACGTENDVAGNMLKAGISQSCGCLTFFESKPEKHVAQYLDDNGFDYTQQKTFPDLLGVGGRLLSYDFIVYKDDAPLCLIEYQGLHHFEPVAFYGGMAKFQIQQQHDASKRAYAMVLELPLFEIHHTKQIYTDVASELDKHFRSII